MRTPPVELSDDDVAAVLVAGWGLAADGISYAPVGFGSHHWHVTASGERWFATVDELRGRDARSQLEAALETALRLQAGGLDFVVAPVPASDGQVAATSVAWDSDPVQSETR